MLVLNPYPQTPFPGKGAILLGLPPLDPVGGYAPKQGCFGCLPKVLHDAKPTEQAISDTHFYIIKRFIDSLKHGNVFPCLSIYLIYICTAKSSQSRQEDHLYNRTPSQHPLQHILSNRLQHSTVHLLLRLQDP